MTVYLQAPLPIMPNSDVEEEELYKRFQEIVDEHRNICDLIAKGDCGKAYKALERHLKIVQHQ